MYTANVRIGQSIFKNRAENKLILTNNKRFYQLSSKHYPKFKQMKFPILTLPKNDLILLTDSSPFLNRNGDPFSTTTAISLLESKLNKPKQNISQQLKKTRMRIKLEEHTLRCLDFDEQKPSKQWRRAQSHRANHRAPRIHLRQKTHIRKSERVRDDGEGWTIRAMGES